MIIGMFRMIGKALLLVSPMMCLAQSTGDVTFFLKSKDQALLDAIAPGDRAVWDGVLAPDFFYADENMRIISRADFLKELQPLPKGSSGNIVITTYEMHRVGDTAIVVHRDSETENYFGSELRAEYLMTETWQLFAGDWKLRNIHCAAIPVDAPTIELNPTQMDELVGTYQAGTLRYIIRREGERLLGSQPGRREVELKAETRDVLIVPGQPRSRKVFRRDKAGKVTGFADRRENRDLVWSRSQSG
jgi:hypothetical protein